MPMKLSLGDKVELKKKHACGCNRFTITRVGMDIKFQCDECKRIIMLERDVAEKRIKKIISEKE